MNNDNQNELFTWVVKAGVNRIYYLNVKQDRNGMLYLVIKESKRMEDGSKEVHRIMIFEKDLDKFVTGMKNALQFMSDRAPQEQNSDSDSAPAINSDYNQSDETHDSAEAVELN
jgi:hypothetical protein